LQITLILQMPTNKKVLPELLYPNLPYKIVGLCFDVHNEVGSYAREKQYAGAVEKRLKNENISHKREYHINDSGNIVDFLIEEKVLLELKTVRALARLHFNQIQNYLQQSEIKLGLLINFSDKFLRPKRILRSNK